jgi:hypothetical protein
MARLGLDVVNPCIHHAIVIEPDISDAIEFYIFADACFKALIPEIEFARATGRSPRFDSRNDETLHAGDVISRVVVWRLICPWRIVADPINTQNSLSPANHAHILGGASSEA